jgi:hypothetical protein
VWVPIPDPQGRNLKCRPAVIITEEVTPDGEVGVVGITTKFDETRPEVQTELQFDPRGNCRSGLRERSWAVAYWVEMVLVAAIESYSGMIPAEQLDEIHRKIEALPLD